jgi:uncharacterized membrane protein YqjE
LDTVTEPRPNPAGPAISQPPLTPPLSPSAATDAQASAKHAAQPSIGELVGDVTTHLQTIVRGEIELAKIELRSTIKNAGVGAGMFAAAAVVLVFSLTFGFFALAEGIAAAGLDRWLAFLIVFGAQLVLVIIFVLVGIKKVKSVRAPQRTISTTKETVAYLRDHG